jgi:hypothetical protein
MREIDYLQVKQYGGLNVGDFSIQKPEQTWLAFNIASHLQVGTQRHGPSRRHNVKVTTALSYLVSEVSRHEFTIKCLTS